MAPQKRNMGWRKPVPKLAPESSGNAQRPSRTALRRLSLTIVNKDVPPLPTDWRESIDNVLKRDKRHAVYLSTSSSPPSPPPKDYAESLAPTLVEELQDATPYGPPHDEFQPIQCVQRPQASPALARRPSQKSLPQIYRPPTPPLPAQHPKLRGAACSSTSSESVAYTLYSGLMSADRPNTTPSLNMYPEKAPEALRHADAQEARRRCVRSPTGNVLSEKPVHSAGGSPRAYRASAASTSTAGQGSTCGRSDYTTLVCSGVWYALKGWGLHVRAKMSHAGRY